VTSIKKFPTQAMLKRDDIIVIPTHPMFGPYISSIAGQVFVLTAQSEVKSTSQYKYLKNFLQENKAKVREETPEYHDKMMAVVQ
jgi:prephenate dehydrogenase